MKSLGKELIQGVAERQIPGGHGDAGGHLHPPLQCEQRTHIGHDAIEAAPPALIGSECVVRFGGAIEAHRHGETELFEKRGIGLGEQGAIGRDGETQRDAASLREPGGAPGHFLQHRSVHKRLTTQKGEVEPGAGLGARDEQIDRLVRGFPGHVFGRAAEIALLRIAIRAAKVALLRDRQRERVHRRIGQRLVVDPRRTAETEALQQAGDAFRGLRGAQLSEEIGAGIE